MKFTPTYLKNKGQKVRFESKQEKENLRENIDITVGKKKCYNNYYFFYK